MANLEFSDFIVLVAMLYIFIMLVILFSSLPSSFGEPELVVWENGTLPIGKTSSATIGKINHTMSGNEIRTSGIGTNLSKVNQTVDNKLATISSDVRTLNKTIQGTPLKIYNLTVLPNSLLTLDKKLDTFSTAIKNLSASISKPSQSGPVGILPLDILIGLGGGTVAAALIAYYANRWVQTRQQTVEIAKTRMQTITNIMPIYGKLSRSYLYFSKELKKEQTKADFKLCFFYVYNILVWKKEIFEKYGGYIFSDFNAENIIYQLSEEVDLSTVIFDKGNLDPGVELENISKIHTPYYQFHSNISKEKISKELYEKFENWLNERDYMELSRLADKCHWVHELITFELNQIFDMWYGTKPPLNILSSGLLKYLSSEKNEYCENYYKRIKVFEFQRSRKIKWQRRYQMIEQVFTRYM